ncbi:hypothetical protein CDD81_6076 [Ophiocordyceps australis]|uniref:Uncharacterized protein n=1 Tax=Ophiocordyceps australis TaxID=1399860 RepID=A0A2C5Y7S3_9HYPO|nr:hypothetical protein CDD81_6076 [Ophiocordyceps australis]
MHLSVVVSTLFGGCVLAQSLSDIDRVDAEKTKHDLEHNYVIDWEHAPSTTGESSRGPGCGRRSSYMPLVGSIPYNSLDYGSWLKLSRLHPTNITVYFKSAIEGEPVVNVDVSEARIATETWTTDTDEVSKGWQVGAHVGFASRVSISASYHEHYSHGHSVTRIGRVEKPCPGLSRCVIQTNTYHARIAGTCERVPFIRTRDRSVDEDPCRLRAGNILKRCQAQVDFVSKTCRLRKVRGREVALFATHKYEPCEIKLPLFIGEGAHRKPYTTKHLYATSIAPTPRAYEKHPHGWCRLTSGRLYRDDHGGLYSSDGDAWIHDPSAIPPSVKGFEPCHPVNRGGVNVAETKVPRVLGQFEGLCYLNTTHYYADGGEYYTGDRGCWYRDPKAPKVDGSGQQSCPKTVGEDCKAETTDNKQPSARETLAPEEKEEDEDEWVLPG